MRTAFRARVVLGFRFVLTLAWICAPLFAKEPPPPVVSAAIAAAAFVPSEAGAGRTSPLLPVGVARRDITPDYPVRLSGYGGRRTPHEGVAQRIHAKALAFGGDAAPLVLLTVDNCGVPASIRAEVLRRLSSKTNLQDRAFAVCSSHTHCAPMLVGILPNLFSMDIPAEHGEAIGRYTREFTDALEQVALEALSKRQPCRLAWGIGSAEFAANRRTSPVKPVDHALPLLRVSDPHGKVLALLTSYACHCTTIGINSIHGDWAGCAQEALEREFPGAIALTAIGCGADQNPSPRRTMELVKEYGEHLATEAARLARSPLIPIATLPEGHTQSIELPFDTLPDRQGWEQLAASSAASIAYHARKNLARLDKGETLPKTLPYMVQSWCFGEQLAMVFLPGEVVVDYSIQIKTRFDHRRLWVNGYSNDVPAYIPSKRILEEGGYEGGGAMVYYDRPTRFAPDVETRILGAVQAVLPGTFRAGNTRSEQAPGTPDHPSPLVPGKPRLVLPPQLHAVVGCELSLRFANTILAEDPSVYRFAVDCPVGRVENGRWVFTPEPAHAGTHALVLHVRDAAGVSLAVARTTLHVAPADAGASLPSVSVLIVGDSLTAGGVYPAEVARLFASAPNPPLQLIGTRSTAPNVAHEGYGGWTWRRFLTQFVLPSDATQSASGKVVSSPFLFASGAGEGYQLDFKRYLSERAGGRTPDFITVLLGINDCFRLKAANPTALDEGITDMMVQAEKLLEEFAKAAPHAKVGICLVPPPNDNPKAFEASYKQQYPRWNWKQVQHRLLERQIRQFENRQSQSILVPTGFNLDTQAGYPADNAVHPNATGYGQIGATLYFWLKNQCAQREALASRP